MAQKNRNCKRCGRTFITPRKLRDHLNKKFPCRPQNSEPEILPDIIHNPEPEILPDQIPNPETDPEYEFLKELGLIHDPEPEELEEVWPELGGDLLTDKAKAKTFKSKHRDGGFFPIDVDPPKGDLLFEESEVGDPERPHSSLKSMSKWQAIVPSWENPAYGFNQYIDNPNEYKKVPYMPQLMSACRDQITRVLKAELRRKDQIKSAIVVLCTYNKSLKEKGDVTSKVGNLSGLK